ncbi:MAG: class I SAM-dependent methyltransferase [Magnetococcales bacterium]|nr:class I SAM-dependent methyltransferase [Magnetococcales bacterium]
MRKDLDAIRCYWSGQAELHGTGAAASWSDVEAVELEIRTISRYLKDGMSVLDVGCANGYSTLRYAMAWDIDAEGFDYIPAMVENANLRLKELPGSVIRGRISFRQGDLLGWQPSGAHYDVVISTRVIINLGTWENQLKAMRACVAALKPGGLFLLSEATLQGWRKLNAMRREWGLAEIPMPEFNQYLDQERVVAGLADIAELIELSEYSSSYFVGTRVIKPLLARLTDGLVDPAKPEMEINRWFASLPAAGDYGTQKLFVFCKRP